MNMSCVSDDVATAGPDSVSYGRPFYQLTVLTVTRFIHSRLDRVLSGPTMEACLSSSSRSDQMAYREAEPIAESSEPLHHAVDCQAHFTTKCFIHNYEAPFSDPFT